MGAVLLAALAFRGVGPGTHAAGIQGGPATAAVESIGKEAQGDGPWIASCEYWAPGREAPEEKSRGRTSLNFSPLQADGSRKVTLSGAEVDGSSDCEGGLARWGLPVLAGLQKPSSSKPKSGQKARQTESFDQKAEEEAALKPRITIIVATVPDPVHTNMAPQFDRIIDALIDAAGDNGYLGSYYWLPWKKEQKSKEASEAASGASRSDLEHEPGLIIFKPIPQKALGSSEKKITSEDISNSFQSALYVFLVGETPTSGVNAYQMERAFKYQAELKNLASEFASSVDDPEEIDMIGPIFSGSAVSLRRAIDKNVKKQPAMVSGITATPIAADLLSKDMVEPGDHANACQNSQISYPPHDGILYRSFADNFVYEDRCIVKLIEDSGVSSIKVAKLVEDGTTLGWVERQNDPQDSTGPPVVIRFPREISLLRNAHNEQPAPASEQDSAPSPYLRFSLKGSNASDSVPHLDRQMTPVSQEAQLMAIQRQLERYRAEYIIISATNVLDELFLAQFLHRAIPDARLVFEGGDLLFEREIDDVPFIGSITVSPYNLIAVSSGGRAFSDWATIAYYNAASYTFWDPDVRSAPLLVGYQNFVEPGKDPSAPSLWVTAIGTDGYYPLGIASPVASYTDRILPSIPLSAKSSSMPRLPVRPSRAWHFLCLFVFLLCIGHAVILGAADYWSPFTRDLAIDQNDQPYRRSMSINIGGVMLFCMAFVVAWPLFAAKDLIQPDTPSDIAAIFTLIGGFVALSAALAKTRKYALTITANEGLGEPRLFSVFSIIALATAVIVPFVWHTICNADPNAGISSYAHVFFAYRCLTPSSGVSPLVPMALLFFSWYLWSVFQTLRLRFSDCNRPVLPDSDKSIPYPLYISDKALSRCDKPGDSCLYQNITSLLITREIVQRFTRSLSGKIFTRPVVDIILTVGYLLSLLLVTRFLYVRTLDRVVMAPVFSNPKFPILYELLISALFFPLLVINVTGALRMVYIWGALKRSLLQRLEGFPIRFAFDRLKVGGWMSIFRQSGLREQLRDMARSAESMRQLVHQAELMDGSTGYQCKFCPESELNPLKVTYARFERERAALVAHIEDPAHDSGAPAPSACDKSGDPLNSPSWDGLKRLHAIELLFAEFATHLLKQTLMPYWEKQRAGFVQSVSEEDQHDSSKKEDEGAPKTCSHGEYPEYIQRAEEFIAIRYLALIRAVMVNLRYLMTFVTSSFVLAIVAWNSYPFEPRQLINWLFTILLASLGIAIVWVFAQMHRDPILSRITDKKPNELGWDFYLRIASFGGVPVLTWLAYNYPQIGGTLFKLLQSGSDVMK
jgi:hypothetical protein